MDDSLFSQIIDTRHKILSYNGAEDAQNLFEIASSCMDAHNSQAKPLRSNNKCPLYSFAIVEAVKKFDKDSIITPCYIEYKIALTRQSDGELHIVMKRYRELKSFYIEISCAGCIGNSSGLTFPGLNSSGTEDWFTGASSNPDGAFVKSRKTSLECYYQKLFDQNPSLYEHPKTIVFFQLNSIIGNAPSSIVLTASPSFNLRDKYKDHLEDEDQSIKYYMCGNERVDEVLKVDQRASWEV